MKPNTIIKHSIFPVILSVLILTPPLGCKKFLEQTDTSNVAEDALFKKPEDAIQLVNALYNTFDQSGNWDIMKFSFYYINAYLPLDHINYGGDRGWAQYLFSNDNQAFEGLWIQLYKGIASANAAIPIIEKMRTDGVLDQELADRLSGETYFLRGIFYYYLACAFGGVPLELKTLEEGDNGLHPRNTQDEVFAAVESDLTTAAGLLPEKDQIEIGRATRGAAYAYLGAAQMWLGKYSEAVSSFDQVATRYQLLPNYLDIHEYDNQNNDETIFAVQFLIPSGGTRSWGRSNDATWLQSFNMPEEITGLGFESASPSLYASFQSGDTRKLASIIGPGDEHPSPAIKIKNYVKVQQGFANGDPRYIGTDGNIINTAGTPAKPWIGSDPSELRSGYFNVKTWRDPRVTNGNDSLFGDQSVIMMRLGEVLVSKAEAQLKAGDEAGAMATIQTVRDRAWGKLANPSVSVPAPVETEPMQIILDEYRHEIAGENSLWFDLRRSGELIPFILDRHGVQVPAGRDLMPIPASALATNPTLEQNPNY
ncbi:MAG: RagB/SusD family nutrient uptake outer membrane protein [Chitinophagaceae bacterium]|nr:RagB/SusD family nutrient uptake outer membrane protein [Chitinophagaceae bacterium]